ncbi:MAG: PAS domain S-box protein [Candidatus Eisenbacteria bacterium]|nr:PAS domain S-box protein [Candidatus Latescibacterota bacterium]MBD3302869.1 PAS domain S-box protein [Candidatus Eisenbacteria bacterium]
MGESDRLITGDPELYRRFFYDTTDGIVITDADGRIVDANPAWLTLYGYSLDEVRGETTRIIRSEHTTPDVYEEMWAAITDPRKGCWQGELINRKRNGEEVPVLLTVTPIWRGERVLGYTGLTIDRSEQLRIEEMKTLYQEIVRHDLKAPLAAILALVDVLRSGDIGPLAARQVEILGRIDASGRKMQEILETSLDIEKMKRGKLALHPEPVDLEDLVARSVASLEELASRKDVEIAVSIRGDSDRPLPPARLDAMHLERCVDNLVMNAIHASPRGETVLVEIQPRGERFAIRVANRGDPIPPSVRAILTHPYSTYGKRGGSGLGVYGVNLTIEAMGGRLSYQSDENGTVFEIVAPFEQEAGRSSATGEGRGAR